MARQSSTRVPCAVVDRPLDDLIRLGAAMLVLVMGMAVVSLPTGSGPSPWTAFWSTVTASMRWQPSDAQVGSQLVDPDAANRANDDGYLEGLAKAVGNNL